MSMNNQPWNQNQNQQQTFQQTGNAAPLSEQELAYNLLYQEKTLMSNIGVQVLEASNQQLRQVINDNFLQMGQDQLQIFNIMSQNGWYQTKPVQQQELQQAKQKFQQTRGSM